MCCPLYPRDDTFRVAGRIDGEKRRALDADGERLFQRFLEQRFLRAIVEVRNEHRQRGPLNRGRGRAHETQVPGAGNQ